MVAHQEAYTDRQWQSMNSSKNKTNQPREIPYRCSISVGGHFYSSSLSWKESTAFHRLVFFLTRLQDAGQLYGQVLFWAVKEAIPVLGLTNVIHTIPFPWVMWVVQLHAVSFVYSPANHIPAHAIYEVRLLPVGWTEVFLLPQETNQYTVIYGK